MQSTNTFFKEKHQQPSLPNGEKSPKTANAQPRPTLYYPARHPFSTTSHGPRKVYYYIHISVSVSVKMRCRGSGVPVVLCSPSMATATTTTTTNNNNNNTSERERELSARLLGIEPLALLLFEHGVELVGQVRQHVADVAEHVGRLARC